MNLPNKLTVGRIIIIPFFVFALLKSNVSNAMKVLAFVLFLLASLTDLLDGYIARSRNLISSFGKFADPIADKLLVCSALIGFVQLGTLPAWIVILIVSRELIIGGIRLVAVERGVVIAASTWGKLKTDSQLICCMLLIINQPHIAFINNLFVVLMVILTIASLVDYIIKNKAVFYDNTVSEDDFDTNN